MIRIDLGKDELQKAPRKAKALSLGKLKLPKSIRFSKFSGDVGTLLAIGAAIALAVFPHLCFTQYRSYIVRQNEATMKVLREKTDVVNQEIIKLQPFQKELESYEGQKKLVKDRLDAVRDLLGSRGTPVNVLDALGQSLPQRTWVNNLSLVLSATGSTVKVLGSSFSNEDISDFVDKLSESVYLTDVTLEDVAPAKAEQRLDVRAFTVSAKPKVKFPVFAKRAGAAPEVAPGVAPGQPGQPPNPAERPPGNEAATQPGNVAPPPGQAVPPPGPAKANGPARGNAGEPGNP